MTEDKLPLVSVITPCFNDGMYLKETVNSIKQSSYSNIELIIINDGSTDPTTLKVLGELSEDKTINIINTPNQGVCKARNQAIKASTGKYILPVDGDDLISKDYIALAVDKLENDSDLGVVATNYKYFGKRNDEVILPEFSIEQLICNNIFTISSVFRREDFDRIGGFDEQFALGLEDWDFWISLLKDGKRVEYLYGFHFLYRIKARKKSRNSSIHKEDRVSKLRYMIWCKHKELFSMYFLDPKKCFEYLTVIQSREYRVGKLILTPIRKLLKIN